MKFSLAVIGCGNMGSALLRGFLKSKAFAPDRMLACDIDCEKLACLASELGIEVTSDCALAARESEVVILAVKPGLIASVAADIGAAVKGKTGVNLVVSVAAGMRLADVEALIPEISAARVMPNLACSVLSGVAAVVAWNAEIAERVKKLFSPLGLAIVLPDEEQLDTMTGLSGSGPAYVFTFIEALADGAVKLGLPRHVALQAAAQTVLGAAALARETGRHPAELRDMVASPGGTTIAGLHVLEQGAFRGAVMSAVEAAKRRAEKRPSLFSEG